MIDIYLCPFMCLVFCVCVCGGVFFNFVLCNLCVEYVCMVALQAESPLLQFTVVRNKYITLKWRESVFQKPGLEFV